MSAFSAVFFRHYAEARGSNEEEIQKATRNIRMWLSQKTSELRRKRPLQKGNSEQAEAPVEAEEPKEQ